RRWAPGNAERPMRVPSLNPALPMSGLGAARGALGALGWKRGLVSLAVVVGSSVAGFQGYQRLHPEPKAAAPLQTATASQRSIVERVSLPGTVGAGRQSKLSFAASTNGASVNGTVKSVSVKTGDSVRAGQEVARLDTTSLDLAVKQAQSSLQVAQLKMQQLLAGAQSSDVASAEQSVISAQAGVQKAQNDLLNL